MIKLLDLKSDGLALRQLLLIRRQVALFADLLRRYGEIDV